MSSALTLADEDRVSRPPAPRAGRRRDSVLEVIELFRSVDAQVSSLQISAFLYLCENEGLSISELAYICRTSLATASRMVQTLAAWQAEVGGRRMPLVDWTINPADGRGKQLYLSESGIAFRARIDEIIRAAIPTRLA